MSTKEENILEAHFRIYNSLTFIISCYDVEYAYKYINNLNKKTYKNYFTVIKTDDPTKINDIYKNADKRILIFIVKLPTPADYSFNFLTNIYHIHIAVPWAKSDKDYINNIKKLPVQKFINVKDNRKEYYDDEVEDKLYDNMIYLINKKLNNIPDSNKKFKRMTAGSNNSIIFGERSGN